MDGTFSFGQQHIFGFTLLYSIHYPRQTMPEEFPKIGLDSPSDLNHVIQAIKNHANRMVNQHLISLGLEQESKQFQLAQQGIEKSLQEVSMRESEADRLQKLDNKHRERDRERQQDDQCPLLDPIPFILLHFLNSDSISILDIPISPFHFPSNSGSNQPLSESNKTVQSMVYPFENSCLNLQLWNLLMRCSP